MDVVMHVLETARLIVGNVHSVNLMKRAGMRIGTNLHSDVVYPWVVGLIENRLEKADEHI